jgi:hypothetical protein
MFLLTAAGGAIGLVVAMSTDEKWLVSAKVLLQIGPETASPRPSMVGSPGAFLSGSPRREDVQTEVELLSSPDLLRRAFTRLMEEDETGALGKERSAVAAALQGVLESVRLLPERSRKDRALDKWADNLRIAVVPASTVLEIQCRSDRPKVAVRFLEILLELYQSDHRAAFGGRGLPEVLDGFLEQREQTLAEADARLTRMREDLGIFDVVQEMSLLLKSRAEAETKLRDLAGRLDAVRARVAAEEAQLVATPAEHRLSTDRRPNPTRDELDLRLATARQELTRAEQLYAADSPEVRTAREVVNLLRGLAESAEGVREASAVTGRSTVHDLLREALLKDRAEEKAVGAELAAAEATVQSLMERISKVECARAAIEKAEIDVAEAKKSVTQAHEGARLAHIEKVLDEHKVANVTVVTPPTYLPTPLRRFGLPVRLAITLGGMGAGFGLGLVWWLWRRGARRPDVIPAAEGVGK